MSQRGRPKTFDREEALEAATLLFWERGFEQTSVDESGRGDGYSNLKPLFVIR